MTLYSKLGHTLLHFFLEQNYSNTVYWIWLTITSIIDAPDDYFQNGHFVFKMSDYNIPVPKVM